MNPNDKEKSGIEIEAPDKPKDTAPEAGIDEIGELQGETTAEIRTLQNFYQRDADIEEFGEKLNLSKKDVEDFWDDPGKWFSNLIDNIKRGVDVKPYLTYSLNKQHLNTVYEMNANALTNWFGNEGLNLNWKLVSSAKELQYQDFRYRRGV